MVNNREGRLGLMCGKYSVLNAQRAQAIVCLLLFNRFVEKRAVQT